MKTVIVIGGGAAGMMAAGRAAECGARTILFEKTDTPGRKLCITGRGRCNFTNTAPLEEAVEKFGKKGNFLYPAFYNFFSDDLRKFFDKMGVASKAERGGRVFPVSDDAECIRKALLRYMRKKGAEMRTSIRVKSITAHNGKVSGLKTDGEFNVSKKDFSRLAVVLCTGGMSYPRTGSTGDGYRIAKKIGHRIVEPGPALVPLETSQIWPYELSGLSLENVKVTAFCESKKIAEEFGDMLFTHFGVSGPIILAMSAVINKYLPKGKVFISIDLKPALNHEKLNARLQRDFSKYINKNFSNSLSDILPRNLIPKIVDFSRIPGDKPVNSITREERRGLASLLKDLRLQISRTRPINEAIVTSGGIALEGIDGHTMQSKILQGLYFAGEVIDLDGPTGGYNLQAAFSTGYLAGENAAK